MRFEQGTFCSSASERTGDRFLPFASAAAMKQPRSVSLLHKGLSVGQWRRQQPLAVCLSVGRLHAAYVSALMQGLYNCFNVRALVLHLPEENSPFCR